MATEFRTGIDFESAMAAARKTGEGSVIDGFVERMAERVGAKASVRAVFGDPIERDGLTIIPVARVRWGFGGGAGRGPIAVGPGVDGQGPPSDPALDEGQSGSGTGGGGGVAADPIGYLEVGPDGASFRPITNPMPSPAFLLAVGVAMALILGALGRLFRR